jgi:hypothetical protein
METFQVVKGFVNGRAKWSVVRIKQNFQGVVVCGAAHDTFQDAAAELTRLYRTEHLSHATPAALGRPRNSPG